MVLLPFDPYFCSFLFLASALRMNDHRTFPSTKSSTTTFKFLNSHYDLYVVSQDFFIGLFLMSTSFCKFIIITIRHKSEFDTKFTQFSQLGLFYSMLKKLLRGLFYFHLHYHPLVRNAIL